MMIEAAARAPGGSHDADAPLFHALADMRIGSIAIYFRYEAIDADAEGEERQPRHRRRLLILDATIILTVFWPISGRNLVYLFQQHRRLARCYAPRSPALPMPSAKQGF